MSDNDDFKFVDIDQRMYEYVRATAITNITDALLELITNSIDAYKDIPTDNTQPQQVVVELYRKDNRLVVRDNASGLDGDRIKQCFLTVGSYTSGDSKRGHFSRGAKDISAIANNDLV